MSLSNIRVVLVRTFHPGNIGSAARSMKTMGLSDLCLVAPKDYPAEQAVKMAAGANDLLESLTIKADIADAIKDCTTVIASTARPRGYDLPELAPQTAAEMLVESAKKSPVALLFGPERMGLHNDDIRYAKYRVTIPANPAYSSLNMAAAVQTLSYEIYKASILDKPDFDKPERSSAHRDLPTSEQVEHFYEHLEVVLKEISFLRPHQGETLQRLRQLYTRAQLDVSELNILRGILSSTQKTLRGEKKR